MAGATRTWAVSNERLARPSERTQRASRAVAGAVVSKPTAKKTTSRWGWARAMARACSGEVSRRTSAPSARRASRLVAVLPGTRSMSP